MLSVENRINTKNDLKNWLQYELNKYGNWSIQDCFLITEPSILKRHQIYLRKTEYYINSGHRILSKVYKIKLGRLQNKYSLHIPINCCGRGLYIVHLGPILINGNASIGENLSVHINTAIVAGGTNDSVPVLGNDIILGVGAVVLGGVKIANGVAVGANAVVNKDVLEENIAVAGVPAKKN